MMFDDPSLDYLYFDSDRERKAARLPVCECCGRRIHDEEYFQIEEILCRRCMEHKYMRCTEDYIYG